VLFPITYSCCRDRRRGPGRRKVPQKIYRLAVVVDPTLSGLLEPRAQNDGEVRVKRCGKSAPPTQQCGGQGKPHAEQDQIGREIRLRSEHVPARCVTTFG
jgi:hypothetical protein